MEKFITPQDETVMPEHENRDFQTDEEQFFEHYRFVADKGQTLLRIDKYLFDHMANKSRNRIQQAISQGMVLVGEKKVKSNYRVKPGDIISIIMDTPRFDNSIIAEDIPLDIAYEDDDIIIINKPPGLVVHPGCGNTHGTLINAIAWHMRNNPKFDANDPQVGLVHRIDKDTSGLIVVAKTADAKSNLGVQFYNKTTKRTYNAIVWGNLKEATGTIMGNITRNPRNRLQMTVSPDPETGKPATTHYRVIKKLGHLTWVECNLETGRTHQIRVHMKHIGHTLFNDECYGGNEILRGTHFSKYTQFVKNCFEICPRQALHAKTLGFIHPTSGKEVFFDSELPSDIYDLIQKWEDYTE